MEQDDRESGDSHCSMIKSCASEDLGPGDEQEIACGMKQAKDTLLKLREPDYESGNSSLG